MYVLTVMVAYLAHNQQVQEHLTAFQAQPQSHRLTQTATLPSL